ncbi:sulfite exporter TauE/SafE family protein [uncultured Paraglaciecola sp.]|uniref:sulfite exporter TauE/SafE family protein n=1 Tax=uncultured Paraglaciecola sp. TaxID=1765024 RepID=UPI002591B591|nr:sulfite exporter TauE/SafE family protein [uncultured Paraglaciecola sp.]
MTSLFLSAKSIQLTLICVWFSIFICLSQPWSLLQDFGAFAFLGVVGAIFANSTGAGGGVVFMPFFNQLGFSVTTSVATSFAIQCCGMTAGALTWYAYFKQLTAYKLTEVQEWSVLPKVLILTIPASVIGLWLVQFNSQSLEQLSDPDTLHLGFGIFSMGLSLGIIASVFWVKTQSFNKSLYLIDYVSLSIIGLVGGAITAWLSIGVGELIAVYLIARRFNVAFAIAAAVIVSAVTVWAGIVYHLVVTAAVYWPVVLFAGAGAIIGGVLAKKLVLYFSPKNLKLFFGVWIFILGLTSLPF